MPPDIFFAFDLAYFSALDRGSMGLTYDGLEPDSLETLLDRLRILSRFNSVTFL